MEFFDSQSRYEKAEQLVADEIADPSCAGRYAARWARIKQIEAELRKQGSDQGKGKRKKSTPFYETPEWKRLAHELRFLYTVERTHAMRRNWPIWQKGQHCRYLDDTGTIRHAEVICFNLEDETIECTTWGLDDFLGYVDALGKRTPATITVHQIHGAAQRQKEQEAALKVQQRGLKTIAERESFPLFASQIN